MKILELLSKCMKGDVTSFTMVPGVMVEFLVGVKLQHESASNVLLFSLVMDNLTTKIQDEIVWCMLLL